MAPENWFRGRDARLPLALKAEYGYAVNKMADRLRFWGTLRMTW